MGRISIDEAVDVYIVDMRTRNQAPKTVANARSLFKGERNPVSLVLDRKVQLGKAKRGKAGVT